MRLMFLLLLFLLLTGCPKIMPSSEAYLPTHGSYEGTLWSKARRDVFPEDVRQRPEDYKDQVLLWTGIVQATRLNGGTIITDYEHHYWDWVLDYGTQQQIAFLSPRGEGKFRCIQKLEYFGENFVPSLPPVGSMAIVYGTVQQLESGSIVSLDCAPLIKVLPPEKFATDVWEYGRDFVLGKDKADFKLLRVPLYK